MRALILIVLVTFLLLGVGWLRFYAPNGNPTFQVDTEKVKEDTSGLIEGSRRAFDEAQQRSAEPPDTE